jgi:hypothetical protein
MEHRLEKAAQEQRKDGNFQDDDYDPIMQHRIKMAKLVGTDDKSMDMQHGNTITSCYFYSCPEGRSVL